jgi:hypothetical protein
MVFLYLDTWVRVGCGIPHYKGLHKLVSVELFEKKAIKKNCFSVPLNSGYQFITDRSSTSK